MKYQAKARIAALSIDRIISLGVLAASTASKQDLCSYSCVSFLACFSCFTTNTDRIRCCFSFFPMCKLCGLYFCLGLVIGTWWYPNAMQSTTYLSGPYHLCANGDCLFQDIDFILGQWIANENSLANIFKEDFCGKQTTTIDYPILFSLPVLSFTRARIKLHVIQIHKGSR